MSLVLSRSDVQALLTLPDCIAAVEQAFRVHAEQRTFGPWVLGKGAIGRRIGVGFARTVELEE